MCSTNPSSTIHLSGNSNSTNLILNSDSAQISEVADISEVPDISSSIITTTTGFSNMDRFTVMNLEPGNPVYYEGNPIFQAYSDLYIPDVKTNKASVFSFGTAMGPMRKLTLGIEYNFGPYHLDICNQLTGNYYDILLQGVVTTPVADISTATALAGKIEQIWPEGQNGLATFTFGPAVTGYPIEVSNYSWPDISSTYMCGGETIFNLASNFCAPSTGQDNISNLRVSCIVAAKSMKDIAAQIDNLFNTNWLYDQNDAGRMIIWENTEDILTKLKSGNYNITTICGEYYHPNIDISGSVDTFNTGTKVWIRPDSSNNKLDIARSWYNPEYNYREEFIEFMTVKISQ